MKSQKFSVVIGTNYGDEGKGLTTDWLSVQEPQTAVARFSGGANAGHTVTLEDGTSHVFSHFGSGTLNGIPTILTRDFIVNPVLFWNELERLPKNIDNILVYVDPRCKVTTPLDVMLNQERERIRDNSRHGSTGVGINETVTRHEAGYELTVGDLQNSEILDKKLKLIHSLFINEMDKINKDFDFSIVDGSIQRFKHDSFDFTKFVIDSYDEDAIKSFNHVVFEGSQGLMLDANSDDFPYVTRANTGVTNLVKYINENVQLVLYYITRSYLSRHGAGPMPTEDSDMSYFDSTNQPNEFQGKLRFGELDYDRMKDVVQKDLEQLNGIDYNVNTMMTWYLDEDKDFEKLKKFSKSIGASNWYFAKSLTRKSVKIV